MKYCAKCGAPMEDDMKFCPKCGEESSIAVPLEQAVSDDARANTQKTNKTEIDQPKKSRSGMLAAAIICFVFAAIYLMMIGFADFSILGMTVFFLLLGIMFMMLAFTPKDTPYYTFKNGKKIKKSILVILAIVIAFMATFFVFSITDGQTKQEDDSTVAVSGGEQTTSQLSEAELVFKAAFDCPDESAQVLCRAFEKAGLVLTGEDAVSRRTDLDEEGVVAYEIANVAQIDGEQQRAFLYLTEKFSIIDLRFLTEYLYQNGTFVQTAQDAFEHVQWLEEVGWAQGAFTSDCPVSINARMEEDIIGTPQIKCYITNHTDKKILAVQIMAQPLNVYGESIREYGWGDEYMNLISDEPIAAGDGESIYWTLYGYDDAKTAKLWLYSVYFADGSQWGAREGLSLEQIQEFGVNLTAQ